MAEKETLTGRGRAHEDEYFRRKDQERLGQTRREAEHRERRGELAVRFGLHAEHVLGGPFFSGLPLGAPRSVRGIGSGDTAVSPLGPAPVLACVEVDDRSLESAWVAARIARVFEIPLLLLCIAAPHRDSWLLRRSLGEEPPNWTWVQARSRLERVGMGFPQFQPELVVIDGNGDLAEAVAALAVQRRVGLVVVGLPNENQTHPLWAGSAAYQILRLAAVPVLAIRASCADRWWFEYPAAAHVSAQDTDTPSLGYVWRPYTANRVWARLS